MMTNDSPRIRALLRQADRNVEAGKFAAAEELYRQILDEAPQNAAAWLGIAATSQDEAARDAAYQKALEIDPEAVSALLEASETEGDASLAAHNSQTAPAAAVNNRSAAAAVAAPAPAPAERDYEVVAAGTDLYCYRHPQRSTSLRCYKCNKPICSECTVKTPVGYLCPDCYREAEDAFFNATPMDYVLALLVALPISLLAGWLVSRFSSGFFFIIIMFFIGGAVGGLIGRLTKRVIGGRRGRYIPHLVAACLIIGVLVWTLPALLAAIFVNPAALFSLIGPGVFLATAVGSAFYWAR